MRFLHTADWQLGMPAHFLSEETRTHYAAARLAAVRRIGEIAKHEHCDFVLVCGDVFDANQLTRATVARSLEALRSIPVPVYLLPGNHDPYDAGSIYRRQEFEQGLDHVHVLSKPGPLAVADGVELVAAPWPSKRPVEDLVAAQCRTLPPMAGGGVRILAGHGALDTFSSGDVRSDVIRTRELRTAVEERRVHYVALGDRHSLTDAGIQGRVWYCGTPEVTAFDEDEPGHCLVVDLDDQHCAVTVHTVGTWTFRVEEAHLNCAADIDAFEQRLAVMPDKDKTAVKHVFKGTLSLQEASRLENMLDKYKPLFAYLDPWERHTDLAVLPDGGDVDGLNLSGYAADTLAHLRQVAGSAGDDAATAQDALRLLYRLAGGAR